MDAILKSGFSFVELDAKSSIISNHSPLGISIVAMPATVYYKMNKLTCAAPFLTSFIGDASPAKNKFFIPSFNSALRLPHKLL